MTTYHPDPVFTKRLKISKTHTDTKNILLIDEDTPVYGIEMPEERKAESSKRWALRGLLPETVDRDIGQVYRYDQSRGKALLGEIKRVGETRDKWKWNGGEWKPLKDVWDRFSQLRETELYDGRNYIWFLDGYHKILCRGPKDQPALAMYVDEGTDKEILWLTKEAYAAGDMLFITLMTSEGVGARKRFQAPLKQMNSAFFYASWS
ncbi:hypothetical protein CPB86DRAFT_794057 [Serendipita vermifera]|nr:hypothetical protein CPB86DRAFT_794057 [Serendipita vermifera]